MDSEEQKKPKKKSKFPYIIIAVVVAVVAIMAVMMLRIKKLQEQLDLGQTYLKAEQYDEAIAAYEKGLGYYPGSADAYLGIVEAMIGQGRLSEAITVLDKGIKKTKSDNLEQSRTVIMDQVFATYVIDSYLVNILPGDKHQLSVIRRSEDMNFDVSWKSQDEKIATVDETGLITAVDYGNTYITATIGNDIWGFKDVDVACYVGVMTTYLEEEGCEYVSSPKNLKAPAFVYQTDNDAKRYYEGTLDIVQPEAIYSLTKCEASDPDTEGNITYNIEYTVDLQTIFGIQPNSVETKKQWYYNWKAAKLILCDDYTGQVFTEQSLFGVDGTAYDSDVVWNDMTFHISGEVESEWVNEEDWEVTFDEESGVTWAEAPVIGTTRITVSVPKEYQGLVLVMDKKGITDYVDSTEDDTFDQSTEFDDTFIFDNRSDGTKVTPEDLAVIKLINFIDK